MYFYVSVLRQINGFSVMYNLLLFVYYFVLGEEEIVIFYVSSYNSNASFFCMLKF
jgi:hypothetical protein